ncbi:hypothetical protein ACQ4PT_036720 [Festuca glaucescens]
MASSGSSTEKAHGALSPRAARAKLEEELGRLDITDEEATPLVTDDRDDDPTQKWSLAGKVLHRSAFHIQTIASALRPAWGNPRGLMFRSVGVNMFVADSATKRDRDRVWDGSPWHVSNNAVILSEFEDYMQPSELKFDRLSLWARIMNLPFNLRDKKWWLPIAQQIDKKVKEVQFNHVGGFLRAWVTIDIANPLRRWVLIDSAKRKSVDLYEIQYEHVPHFCFSCGRLGHPDTMCPNPGNRDENGKLPFGKGLRASDDWKRPSFSEGSTGSGHNRKAETRSSSNAANAGTEATSPLKKNQNVKHKAEAQQKVYRRVEVPLLQNTPDGKGMSVVLYDDSAKVAVDGGAGFLEEVEERDAKKKKPTSTNSDSSAAAAL